MPLNLPLRIHQPQLGVLSCLPTPGTAMGMDEELFCFNPILWAERNLAETQLRLDSPPPSMSFISSSFSWMQQMREIK